MNYIRLMSLLGFTAITSTAWSQPGQPFVLSVSADKTNYVIGQPISFTIAVSNITRAPLVLHTVVTGDTHAPRFPMGQLEVKDASGHAVQQVPPDSPFSEIAGRNLSGRTEELQADGITSWHVDLGRMFLLTNVGRYSLVAKGGFPDSEHPGSSVTIQSQQESFQIVASSTNNVPK